MALLSAGEDTGSLAGTLVRLDTQMLTYRNKHKRIVREVNGGRSASVGLCLSRARSREKHVLKPTQIW